MTETTALTAIESVLALISSSSLLAIGGCVWKLSKFHTEVVAMQKELAKIQDMQSRQVSEDYLSKFQQTLKTEMRMEMRDHYTNVVLQTQKDMQDLALTLAAVNAKISLIMDRLDIHPVGEKHA